MPPQSTAPTPILSVGESIRRLRQVRGLSQAELAERAGVDRKTVNRIEQGHHSMRVTTLFDIAGVLDVSPQELLD